jgi:hypothetical protein
MKKGHIKINIRKVSSISPYHQELENYEENPKEPLNDLTMLTIFYITYIEIS